MRIEKFSIKNFKNIKLAEYEDLPNFVVICGGNGCGKSSILEALMTAKEALGSYGYFKRNPNAVSADADFCEISIDLKFSDDELKYLKDLNPNNQVGNNYSATIRIQQDGNTSIINSSSGSIHQLLRSFNINRSFFDYFSAHRSSSKSNLDTWNSNFLNEDSMKRLLSEGQSKFQTIKQYLTSLKMADLQQMQRNSREGNTVNVDSLKPIRNFFNSFFAPMKFDDVYLDENPFKFAVETPRGTIDIDELSSGEKEILNTYIHFHHLNPSDSIILFDEPDVHLHPELERRYLRILKTFAEGNQMFLTTHAPEMMIEAGSESLFTVIKYPEGNENQFIKVSSDEELHNSLSIIMGSKGFVSLNRKIVFIEGEEASTDVEVFERFYPSNEHNISFIPAGGSGTVKSTANKVNTLLTSGTNFQSYYCIIDGDMDRHSDVESHENIFQLPVYHIENVLLDELKIYQVTQKMLGKKFDLSSHEEVLEKLKEIALTDSHLLPFTKALLDREVFKTTEKAKDLIFQKRFDELSELEAISFDSLKSESSAMIEKSIEENEWKNICKGRDLLKSYCSIYSINFEHFRNLLIAEINELPEGITNIMNDIIEN